MISTAPITLGGEQVLLLPLTMAHIPRLAEIGIEPSLWKWNPYPVRNEEEMAHYVEAALKWQIVGTALPFVICIKDTGDIVGTTRFGNVDALYRRVEIGWTWVMATYQRTFVNTEAKFLMLRHAFETWGCVRVELKTDSRNLKSKNAILRLGAKQEGILRKHMSGRDGYVRDSIYFSILDEEWPGVKACLEAKIFQSAVYA